jgi:hypothetical protein
LTKLSPLIPSLVIVSFFIRADNLQRVLFVVGSCHLSPVVPSGHTFER